MELISKLAEQGIAYLLLAISFVVIYALFRIVISEKDKRLEDSQKWNDGYLDVIKQVKENGNTHTTYLKQIATKLKITI